MKEKRRGRNNYNHICETELLDQASETGLKPDPLRYINQLSLRAWVLTTKFSFQSSRRARRKLGLRYRLKRESAEVGAYSVCCRVFIQHKSLYIVLHRIEH